MIKKIAFYLSACLYTLKKTSKSQDLNPNKFALII